MSTQGPTVNQQQQHSPYGPAIPYVNDIMQQGAGLYANGAGSGVWQGPTVAPLNPWQIAGMSGIANTSSLLGNAGVPQFNYGWTPPIGYGAPMGSPGAPEGGPGFGPSGSPARMGGGFGAPSVSSFNGETMTPAGVGAPESARGPDTSEQGGMLMGPSGGVPGVGFSGLPGGGVGLGQGATANDGGGSTGVNPANSFTAPNSATQNWSPYTGSPTAGAPGPGNSGAGTALPYLYGLGAIGDNGLSPQMQGQLANLAGIASGQNGITTGGLYGNLYNTALTQNGGANNIFATLMQGSPQLAQLFNQSQGQNAGATGTMAGIMQGSPQLQSLFDRSQTQNAGAGNVFSGVATGANGITTGNQYGTVASQFAGPTSSEANLAGIASGADANNPELKAMLDANDAVIKNRIASTMSGAGRYGSAGYDQALAAGLAQGDAPVLEQAYENAQNRRLAANQQIDAARNAQAGVRLNAIGGETGVEGANIGNQLGAANSLYGMHNADTALGAGLINGDLGNRLAAAGALGNLNNATTQLGAGLVNSGIGNQLSAAGGLVNSNNASFGNALGAVGGLTNVQGQNIANRMAAANSGLGAMQGGANNALGWAHAAPSLAQLAYLPSMTQFGIGNFLQGQNQQELTNQMGLFNQAQAMPWTQLGRYLQAVNGNSPLIGSSGTTTSTQTQQVPWWQVASSLFGGKSSPASGMAGAGSSILSALGLGLPFPSA